MNVNQKNLLMYAKNSFIHKKFIKLKREERERERKIEKGVEKNYGSVINALFFIFLKEHTAKTTTTGTTAAVATTA